MRSFERTWTEPEIDASGLRISWAMPAASSPTAASCSLNRARRSSFFISVRSWKRMQHSLFAAVRLLEDAEREADHLPRAAPVDLDLAAVGLPAARAVADRRPSPPEARTRGRRAGGPGARAGIDAEEVAAGAVQERDALVRRRSS